MTPTFASRTGTALAAGFIALGTAGAHADALSFQNSSGGTATFYGQFNLGYFSVDDGVSTRGEVADSAYSGSRVGLRLAQPMQGGELRFRFETSLALRASSGISQTALPQGMDWDRTDIRHVDFAWVSPSFGTISIGQGSMATDGVAFEDESGTTLASGTSITDAAGGYAFRDGTGTLTTVTIGDVFSTFDGGRRGRIRYDSRDYNGFSFSFAHGTEILAAGNDTEYTDVALRYGRTAGDFDISTALGYRSVQPVGGSSTEFTIASLAVMHGSGVNVAFAAGSEDGGGEYGYAKLGYVANWLEVGSTALSIDYYDGSGLNGAGTNSESWGISAVQKLDDANVELYAGYRVYSYSDASATTYQDVNSTMIGARFKF